MVSAISSTANTRFLRRLNGAPSRTAPNTIELPLDQGATGARLAALEFAEIVRVEVLLPLLVSVTDVGLKFAVTLEAVPLVEVTAGVSATVPA